MNKIRQFFYFNWSFLGIVVFFGFHGYTENEKVVPFNAVLPVLAWLLLIALLLFFINRKLLGNNNKANVFTSIILIDVLFFGVAQDFLFQFKILERITRLRVFVPLCILLIIVVFIWLKKTNRPFARPVLFLNTLLVIYLFIDAGSLLKKNLSSSGPAGNELARYELSVCDTCKKPPVYLVVFDSYFGSQGMKEFFHYDNSRFERLLAGQGFHVVPSSHSNYRFTVFSMASLLNMQYLKDVGSPELWNRFGYNAAVSAIKNNVVTKFMAGQGYKINNFSIFDIQDIPAGYSSGMLPEKVQLITSQTMYYRVNKWLPVFLSVNNLERKKPATDDFEEKYIRNVNNFLEQAIVAQTKDTSPVFTYLHVMMPHAPFLLDSSGNRTNFQERKDLLPKDSINNMFMQYEVYTNNIISTFITRLQRATAGEAVVLLMSDHGYQDATGENEKLPFYNLNAVYLPQKNYSGWYSGISNVNQFRVLLNTLFHQQMPLLADSIVTR